MREKVDNMAIKDMPIAKIKGHTKIILTDTKTGKETVFEHDNTFQNAVLAKFLRTMGVFNNSLWGNATAQAQALFRNLVGGIYLFRDAIDTSGGDVEYMPASNLMVANGAYGVSNTGNPTELGSYNATESSTSGASSITLVYDWDTSHGNGTIGCVCLGNEIGAYIGYGNNSNTVSGTKKSIATNQSVRSVGSSIIYKNHAYSFSLDISGNPNNVLNITKTKRAITKASIFDNSSVSIQKTYNINTYDNTLVMGYSGNGKVLIIPMPNSVGEFANGATVNVLVYDIDADTLVTRSFTNATGVSLCISGMSQLPTDGDVLFIPQREASRYVSVEPLWAIRTSTGAVIRSYGGTGTYSSRGTVKGFPIVDGLWLLYSQKRNKMEMWDVANNVLRVCNASNFDASTFCEFNADDDFLIFHDTSYASAQVIRNPFYLATINNLNSAVTKDATQTMKVIYTLTEA